MNTSTPSPLTAAPSLSPNGGDSSPSVERYSCSACGFKVSGPFAKHGHEEDGSISGEGARPAPASSAPSRSPEMTDLDTVKKAPGPLVGENYATSIGYSDRAPFEIVGRTAKTILVRSMSYDRDPAFAPDMVVGGFSAHTRNNDSQKWLLSSDATAPVERAHARKDGNFYLRGTKLVVGRASYFYDYNF